MVESFDVVEVVDLCDAVRVQTHSGAGTTRLRHPGPLSRLTGGDPVPEATEIANAESGRADDPFTRFAAELSRSLPMITRLLTTHPREGDCHGCRLPSPQRSIQAPCSVRKVAVLALSFRAARETSDRAPS